MTSKPAITPATIPTSPPLTPEVPAVNALIVGEGDDSTGYSVGTAYTLLVPTLMTSLGVSVLNSSIVVMDDPLGHRYPFFAGRVGYSDADDAGSVVAGVGARGVYVSTMGVWQGMSTIMSVMTVTVAVSVWNSDVWMGSGDEAVGWISIVLVTTISLWSEVGQLGTAAAQLVIV